MRSVEALTEQVHREGGKVTSQRILIWRALQDDTTHPTAEDLYLRLKPSLPSLSLATLYNVLNELVEWGDLRRFDTGDGRIHFDPDTAAHAELVCLRCHSVTDMPDTERSPVPVPSEINGYAIVTRSEQYFGFCPSCRKEQETTARASAR